VLPNVGRAPLLSSAATQLPLSFEQAIPIFRHMKINAYQIAPNGHVEAQYIPSDEGIAVNRKMHLSIQSP
jgi:hypothetical protein